MASLKVKFLATSIKMQMHLSVFLPESAMRAPEGFDRAGLKVLWLLHGEGGDCSDWLRLSMVEHYAEAANIALVMPNMDNSMYMDMAHGGYPYFTYLTEDLPHHIRDLVRVLSDKPEDNFVAGAGVGGYGAVKWMLRAPGMFGGCACFSGDVDIVAALYAKEAVDDFGDDWAAAFGSAGRIAGTADDPLALCRERVAARMPLPPIHLACGTSETGAPRRRATARTLADLGLDVRYHEEPQAQGWPLWNARVRDFIQTAMTPRVPAEG